MNRSVIATAGLACLAAGAGQALAAPAPVAEGRVAGTAVSFALPDGDTLSLEIRAVQESDGSLLIVDTSRCNADGCDSVDYSSPLPASAFTVDANNPAAKLETTLSGNPLVITWRPGDSGVVVGGGDFSGSGNDAWGSQYVGTLADVSVRYGDRSCTGRGGVGDGVVADTGAVTGDTSSAPVGALRIVDGAALTCSG